MSIQEERKMILGMLAEGKITAAEAAKLLEALAVQPVEEEPQAAAPVTDMPNNEWDQDLQRTLETTKQQIREAVREASREARHAYREVREQARNAAREARQQAREAERQAREGFKQAQDGSLLQTIFSNFDFSLGFDIFGNSYRFEDVHEGVFHDVAKIGMHVNTANGKIEVFAWDEPKFKVVLRKMVRASSEEEARRKAEEMCTITNTGDYLVIDGRQLTGGNSGLSVEAYLPKDRLYDFDLTSSNGRITLNGLTAAEIAVRSSNGRITLDQVNAQVAKVHTSNGSVSASGDIDDLAARTSNGSVSVLTRVLRATTLQLDTSNGSVRVRVENPEHLAHSLDLSTSMGKVRVELPDCDSNLDSSSRRRVVSRTPDFDQQSRRLAIKAHTSNGSVVVSPDVEL